MRGLKGFHIVTDIHALASHVEAQALYGHPHTESLLDKVIGPGRCHPEFGIEFHYGAGVRYGEAEDEPRRIAVTLYLLKLILIVEGDERPVGPEVLEGFDVLYGV